MFAAFDTLTGCLAAYGYVALFLGIMLENAGVPLPGETALRAYALKQRNTERVVDHPSVRSLHASSRAAAQFAASTAMRRGCSLGCFGIVTSSTPCALFAVIPSASAVSGRVKRR